MWITQFINKYYFTSPDETLSNALSVIDKWCKQNNFDYKILHNGDTGCNRVVFIGKHSYKLIISRGVIETEEIEEYYNTFINEWVRTNKTENVFYAHLEVK